MTRRGKPDPVVVGVDEAGSAEDAVDWATAEAAARGCPLRVVHAFRPPLPADAYGFASPIDSFVTAHTAAQLILGDAVTRARSVAPGIDVSTRLVRGTAARALLGEARDARLLVLGSRGRSGLACRAVRIGHRPCQQALPLPDRRHPPFRQPARRPGLPAVGPPCRRGYRPRRIPLRRDRFRLPRRISTGHTAHRPVGMDTGHGEPTSSRPSWSSDPPAGATFAGYCAARSAERSCATRAARSPSSVVTGRLRVGRPRADDRGTDPCRTRGRPAIGVNRPPATPGVLDPSCLPVAGLPRRFRSPRVIVAVTAVEPERQT